ncbi:MAG TPA: AP2 domain-containing protein [Marmoricola sp.]|nr:AP2 domain-containing protein [Marmoricola sp.]
MLELVRRDGSRHQVLFDEQDADLVASRTWAIKPNGRTTYAVTAGGKALRMHALIMGSPGVDHVNHNGLDNRRFNLRIATAGLNGANRRPTLGASSAYKGVSRYARLSRWQARIRVDGHLRYLGLFDSEEDAALAYNEAAIEAWGEFASVNEVRLK